MKRYVFLPLLLLIISTNTTFSQNIGYFPARKSNVSEEKYRYGIKILEEIYETIKTNNGKLDHVDYWNLAIAHIILKEPNVKAVKKYLNRCKELSPIDYAYYLVNMSKGKNGFVGYVSDEEYMATYKESLALIQKHEANKKQKQVENSVRNENHALAKLMIKLEEEDQKYRRTNNRDLSKQAEIDKKNLEIIDSLYQEHKTYIGNSMVGKNLGHVMWLVIQHSNLNAMEHYLPVLRKAVEDNELSLASYQLTVDRVLAIRHGYQLFGGQIGVKMAPLSIIDSLNNRYQIKKIKD